VSDSFSAGAAGDARKRLSRLERGWDDELKLLSVFSTGGAFSSLGCEHDPNVEGGRTHVRGWGFPVRTTVSRREVECGQVGQSSHEKGAAACDGMRAEGDLRRYDRPERCNAIGSF
jgi:hypothetical protein